MSSRYLDRTVGAACRRAEVAEGFKYVGGSCLRDDKYNGPLTDLVSYKMSSR